MKESKHAFNNSLNFMSLLAAATLNALRIGNSNAILLQHDQEYTS
jgi:hypothetical protein